jgi:argininosuccinate synthase
MIHPPKPFDPSPSAAARRVVLAYSGGLASTAALAELVEKRRAEVVSVTLDVGQNRDLLQVRDWALEAGAVRAHVVDARQRFARAFVLPSLQAGGVDGMGWPLVRELVFPLVAETLVEIAELELATAVAHGAVEHAALSSSIRMLAPSFEIIEPAPGCRAAGTSDTLWGRTATADTCRARSADVVSLPTSAVVDIAFERGVPVSVNGVAMPLVELISSLETIAGAHGVGRFVSPATQGMNGTPIALTAPAAVVLHLAHRELSSATLPSDLVELTCTLGAAYAGLLTHGLWHSPTREAIDAFIASTARRVSGAVRLRLFDGDCAVMACVPGSVDIAPLAATPAALRP